MAVWTLKRLLSRVGPLVLHQIARLCEAFVAFGAFVGSLPGVGALVVSQV